MGEEQITLTKTDLENIIQKAVTEVMSGDRKQKSLTVQNLFTDIKFNNEMDISPINQDFPNVMRLLTSDGERPCGKGEIFTNTTHFHGYSEPSVNYNIYGSQVHDSIRKLVLNVFGKSKNTELTRDEYDQARACYSELVVWFTESYRRRLEDIEKVTNTGK